jgi:adenosylcobinamide-GDP ribazoletransferase
MSDDAQDKDTGPAADWMAWWTDARVAAAFLTRLPIEADAPAGLGALARASRTFPLIGLGVGLLGGIVLALARSLSLDPFLAAVLAVTATIVVTGALHEDGLADTADGFGGGDRDARLRIMRDSRIGTFGVIALILSLAVRIGAVAAIAVHAGTAGAIAALAACHAASRAFIVIVMHREPCARDDGLAVAAGRPSQTTALWAAGLAAVIALICETLSGIGALALGAVVAWAIAWLARRQIGGHTGDVLGAVQQGTEMAMLLAIVALP